MGAIWPVPDADHRAPEVPSRANGWASATEGLALLSSTAGRRAVGLVVLRASGPVRAAWLSALANAAPLHRCPPNGDAEALLGGLDLEATLLAGRPIRQAGLLERARGGTLVIPSATNLSPATIAALRAALDDRNAPLLVLEAEEDGEAALSSALRASVGMVVDLRATAWSMIAGDDPFTNEALPSFTLADISNPDAIDVPDEIVEALDAIAAKVTGHSIVATLRLLAIARAVATMREAREADHDDALQAVRLRFGIAPSASEANHTDEPSTDDRAPNESDAPQTETSDAKHEVDDRRDLGDQRGPDDPSSDYNTETVPPADLLLDAILTALPPDILANAARKGSETGGGGVKARSGGASASRGRAVGTLARPPHAGARIDVPATLRAAAPWQRLRPRPTDRAVAIRPSDLRWLRRRVPAGTTVVFAVDASGSAAHERLAEAKGAIEHLLSQAYARRDEVALIAFRGGSATVLLTPTRGLVAARRAIGVLPGGGGTPLAAAILATASVCDAAKRAGRRVTAVFLTDGRGNVALDGTTGRSAAREDEARAAQAWARSGTDTLVIDTAARPGRHGAALARELGARHIALPRSGGKAIAQAVAESTAAEAAA